MTTRTVAATAGIVFRRVVGEKRPGNHLRDDRRVLSLRKEDILRRDSISNTSPGLASNPVLSPQELVSCDDKDSGCHGGNPILTYEWLESHGLETNSAYPYTSGSGPTAGKDGNCSADLSQERWMVDDFKIITSSDDGPKSDAPIKEWVLNKGKSE